MRLFGFEFNRAKPVEAQKELSSSRGWWPIVSEAFSGAWQRNIEVKQKDLLCYPTLYACLKRVAEDIGKLPFRLMALQSDGIWRPVSNPAFDPVLRKPNHYQTQSQFREQWILSKKMQGNTYVLKQRDGAGVVRKLYILNPWRVRPMVSESGDVFYEVWGGSWDGLSSLVPVPDERIMIPAREIIHDRSLTFHHPLIGVPPLCAAALAAGKNLKILLSADQFFTNGAAVSGILTAPGALSDATADRLATYFNENFTGPNAGRVAVVGDGLKFEPMSMRSVDSQMVEQLRYSDEQICQPFGIPPYKVGIGNLPPGMKNDDINVTYYSDALQADIEHMENLLDEGLGLSGDFVQTMGVECDLDPLLRMDQEKMANVMNVLVSGKLLTPNEGRRRLNYGDTAGGSTLWGQQQDYPLGMLENRADWDPAMQTEPEPVPAIEPPADESRAFMAALTKTFEAA